jgi:sugar/nucleoside kinase (ribokinase family)
MLEARRVYDGPSKGPSAARESSTDETTGSVTPDLVIVGASSRDLTDGDRRGWRLGGAATYCSLAAARLGLGVGCLIGVDEDAANARELDLLLEAGVDLRRVPLKRGPVFENIETKGHRRQRWLSKSDPVPVAALPFEWSRAGGWLLVPVAGEVPDEWASMPPAGARVGLGWQGLLRDFADTGWVERVAPVASRLLGRAALACASLDDLPPDLDTADLRRVCSGTTVVLTAGPAGGLVLDGSGLVRYPALATGTVTDPTGAGDVFLAALMAAWLIGGEPATPRSLRFAAAASSLAVEGIGLAGVPTMAAVAARLGRDVPARRRPRARP